MLIMYEDILNWLTPAMCLLIGIGIGGCIEEHCSIVQLEKAAIQHNAAQYNPTTGKFEWLDKSNGEEE